MSVPERILVVGSGAREHALAWRLAGEPGVAAVHVAPGNTGMSDVGIVHADVAAGDPERVAMLARTIRADLVVVGPEAPLAAGLADRLMDAGIAVFGPTRAAAALETSKSFCRSVAAAAGIPMAEGATFDRVADALEYARTLGAPLVVKADGLAAGKGVTLCPTLEAAEAAVRAAVEEGAFGAAGRRVVVERQLSGREASLMAVCDGSIALALPPARDHKRIGDGDIGPNTGGMGAYSPLPDLGDEEAARLAETFHRPALREMVRRGAPFRGLLYAGLILTADGPRLLEFNVRFGDPEAQATLPRLMVPLAPLLLAAASGRLAEAFGDRAVAAALLPVRGVATVAIVLAAAGYPGAPVTGDTITGIGEAQASGALVFHGATRASGNGFVTAGGRVLTVVGTGEDLVAARARAYAAVGRIRFSGQHYRRDIAAATPAPAAALAAAGR